MACLDGIGKGERAGEADPQRPRTSPGIVSRDRRFPLWQQGRALISASPNFARACGRVPVGGHPVNCRTAARGLRIDGRKGGSLRPAIQVATPDPDNNRQPEAKPANPALHGGRSLKQRRTGFFGLVGPPKVDTEEACFSLPGVRLGSPHPIHGSIRVLCARRRIPCLHSTAPDATHRPLTPTASRGSSPFDNARPEQARIEPWWGNR